MAEQLPEGTDAIITGGGVDARDDDPGLDEAYPTGGAANRPQGGGSAAQGSGTAAGGDDAAAGGKRGDGGSADATGDGSFFERIEGFRSQGYDKAREYAVMGKDRATGALDELLGTINDAADQIDSKLGGQYGDYARRAAESLGGFNEALKGKDVDALFNDARALIAKAPAVAVGTAAVLGFVVARLVKAGLDQPAAGTDAKA